MFVLRKNIFFFQRSFYKYKFYNFNKNVKDNVNSIIFNNYKLFSSSLKNNKNKLNTVNNKREHILKYAPLYKDKIIEYKKLTKASKFLSEEDERRFPQRKQLDEFLQKNTRNIIENFLPQQIAKEFLQPLLNELEKNDIRYIAIALELADISPSYLVTLINEFHTTCSLSEDCILQLYKGGVANYNNAEFLEVLKLWKHISDKDSSFSPYKWGQRIAFIVPIINTKYMQLTLRPLVTQFWFKEKTWKELYEQQEKRLHGWSKPHELDKPSKDEEDLMVPDIEYILGIIGGVCNKWEWSYHVDQRNALFRSLSVSLYELFERQYPHWFTRNSVRLNFIGDLISSIAIGSEVSPRQCDGLIRYWQTSFDLQPDEVGIIILRIRARTQNGGLRNTIFNGIKRYLLRKHDDEIPKY